MQFSNRDTIIVFLTLLSVTAVSQSLKPGLAGMAPSKWLTMRHSHAPGKVYSFPGAGRKTFTQDEYYLRAWIPVVHKEKLTVILGPNYRTEQLEFKSSGENPVDNMSNWDLRTYGLDVNALVKTDSLSWLIFTSHINKSGNFSELSASEIPINYTVSATFLRKKSPNKEIGAGVMMNKSFRVTVLPVFIFNYNYSERGGIEMMLPKKIAWRNNLSPWDILYVKAESVTRTYYIHEINSDNPAVCRRVDIDMGLSYNRRLGKYAGVEVFGGYRKNISNRLIAGATPLKTSGLSASVELYVQPPKFKKKK